MAFAGIYLHEITLLRLIVTQMFLIVTQMTHFIC